MKSFKLFFESTETWEQCVRRLSDLSLGGYYPKQDCLELSYEMFLAVCKNIYCHNSARSRVKILSEYIKRYVVGHNYNKDEIQSIVDDIVHRYELHLLNYNYSPKLMREQMLEEFKQIMNKIYFNLITLNTDFEGLGDV